MTNTQVKLKQVDLDGKSILDFCKENVYKKSKLILNKGVKEEDCDDDFVAFFKDLYMDKYIIIDEEIFEILSIKEGETNALIKDNTDGTIDAMIYYHSGAATWQEILTEVYLESVLS